MVVTTAAVFSLMSMMNAGATLRRVVDSSMLGVHRHFSAAAGGFLRIAARGHTSWHRI